MNCGPYGCRLRQMANLRQFKFLPTNANSQTAHLRAAIRDITFF